MQWQHAFTSGASCSNQTCTDITGIIYSVHQTGDGGYVVAGALDQLQSGGTPLVPWLAKVDGAGDLLWQHLYYEASPSTGASLSEYFASSTLSPGGGVLGLGWTEDPSTLLGDLFAVRTDGSGLVGACTDVRNATPISAINPGLSSLAPAFPLQSTITPSGQGSSIILTTSINTQGRC
jgi:hypothetical protein